jgi:hypothetical protein
MTRRSTRALATFVLAISLAAPIHAQVAQSPRLTMGASHFIFARYASVSASAMYVGYSIGPAGMVLGLVDSPRTTYRELIIGGFTRVARGRQSATVAVAYASASDAPYLQVYLNPSLSLGPVSLSGSAEQYLPVDGDGTRELDFNPVTLLIRVHRLVGIGAAYTVAMPHGGRPKERMGPAMQLSIPHGTLGIEVLRNLNRSAAEVRLALTTSF